MVPNSKSPTHLITAIIPIDDARNGLTKFLSWTQNSDLSNFQIIIILDTDSKEVHQIVTNLRENQEDVDILVTESQGRNPGTSRNVGLKFASGNWVCFWDADDLPEPSKYIEMATRGEAEKADIVVGEYFLVTQNNLTEFVSRVSTTNVGQIYLNPGLWRILFKRETIDGIEFPEISMAEDQIFVFEALKKSEKISFFNKVVYRYFKYETGQLTRNPKKFDDLRIAISLLRNDLIEESGLRNKIKIRMARSCVKNGNSRVKLFGLRTYFYITFESLLLRILNRNRAHDDLDIGIYIPLTGGMGNQLFQLAAAHHYAKNAEVRALSTIGKPRLRADGQVELTSFVFPPSIKVINSQNSNWFITRCFGYLLRSGFSPSRLEGTRLVRWITRKAGEIVFSIFLRKLIRIRIAEDLGYDPKLLVHPGNTLLIGYFQSYKYVADSFSKHIKLVDSNKIDVIEQLRRESDHECPLVVHVRLGDYRNDPSLGVLDENYYAVNVKREWHTGKYRSIWLFSDEPNLAIQRIPQELRKQTKIFSPEVWDTAETLVIMSMGHGYVLANSSFSWWSARLSGCSNGVVVVPEPWFAGRNSPNELNPPLWKSVSRGYLTAGTKLVLVGIR